MKTFNFLTLFVILLLQAKVGIAQNLIAVQNGNTPRFYTQVTDAIEAASSGDTIYIPGGSWDLGGATSLYISKTLHIVGTGHNPVSSQAGGICYLNGSICLKNGVSNGSMTGVLLSGSFTYSAGILYSISNYSITRCRFNGSVLLTTGYSRFVFAENVFDGSVLGGGSTDNLFYNNIFVNAVGNFSTNNRFWNNLWMNISVNSSGSFSKCIFDNNIIFSSAKLGTPTDCVFNNNVFVDNVTFPWATNIGSNNLVNQTQSSIFATQSGNSFNYTQDYHLQATYAGKNAGTDGTDIGIYGGIYPWKEGSIPANPHFESIQVAPKTDNGNLNVRIKVAAQDN